MKEIYTTISLDYPIQVDGQEFSQLTMRRPKVRDRLVAEKGGGTQSEMEIRLIANLCEVHSSVIEDLDMADYRKLQEILSGFLD